MLRENALRIVRDPLLHFMVIGGAIFAAFWIVAEPEPAAGREEIVVTAGEVERLAAFWEKRRLRPPTPEELDGLVDEHVREEVLYREALALGLDRDDAVIRRLLRQKLEFVIQDLAVPEEPDAAELAAWFEANRERYRSPERLSFSQVYFDTDRRGAGGEDAARLVLAGLRAGTGSAGVGDGGLLEPSYRDRTGPEVAALFGDAFAAALSPLEPGVWSGPIRSGYGLHLVRVDERREGAPLPFEAVEAQVRADWAYVQRRRANDETYARLRERYEVIVEAPDADGARP